jgi:hypothetical protein
MTRVLAAIWITPRPEARGALAMKQATYTLGGGDEWLATTPNALLVSTPVGGEVDTISR